MALNRPSAQIIEGNTERIMHSLSSLNIYNQNDSGCQTVFDRVAVS